LSVADKPGVSPWFFLFSQIAKKRIELFLAMNFPIQQMPGFYLTL